MGDSLVVRKSIKIQALTEEFLVGIPSVNTRSNYLADIRSMQQWFAPWTGQEDRLELAKYVRFLQDGQGLGHATIRERVGRLKRLYQFLVDRGLIAMNPVEMSLAPKVRDRRAPQAPDLDELRRLSKLLDPKTHNGLRDTALIALMLYEALRVHEVVRLNYVDIQRFQRGLRLTIHGKGGTIDYIQCLEPTIRILNAYLKQNKSSNSKDPLFPNKSGPPKRLTTRGVRYIVDAYFRKAEWRQGLSCHSLRAAHATICSVNGYPLSFIQRRLRHTHIETTLSYLAHCPTLNAAVLPPLEKAFPINLTRGI